MKAIIVAAGEEATVLCVLDVIKAGQVDRKFAHREARHQHFGDARVVGARWKRSNATKQSKDERISLAKQDYALYEALNMLKGMRLLRSCASRSLSWRMSW